MPRPRVIVLKFGGSVLLDESRLRIAVHEIYRWKREGWAVVAVASALAGRTDQLIDRCQRHHPTASSFDRASIVATGEQESAALLGLHLDRAGVPGCVLSTDTLDLIATGDPLDASPVSIDTKAIAEALERAEVVVVPGYIARDNAGRRVTLGRGGSDLTALVLAHALDAEKCRLIKDVNGLFERDPNAEGPPPPRYTACSYEDALETDGAIIQHKAVEFARRESIPFELGAFNSVAPTTISRAPSQLTDAPREPGPLTVALLGHGSVGAGVAELIGQLPEQFELQTVAVRTPQEHIGRLPESVQLSSDPVSTANSGVDLVVETIGGVDTALTCAESALRQGSALVTANKALLADHAEELLSLARTHGGAILASSSVGGALPVLERCKAAKGPTQIRAVLNGTANFVLNEMRSGVDLCKAVRSAQDEGLAEADPTRDLDGRDALDKLVVIAQALRVPLATTNTNCDIEALSMPVGAGAGRLRQIATLSIIGHASVEIEETEPGDPLFDLPDEMNCVVFELADGATETLRGRGAGRWPTAESVLADLLEYSRHVREASANRSEDSAPEPCHA